MYHSCLGLLLIHFALCAGCKSAQTNPGNNPPETQDGAPTIVTPIPQPSLPVTSTARRLLLDTSSSAARDLENLRKQDAKSAKLIEIIANQPTAVWFGAWNSNVEVDANKLAIAAKQADAFAQLVIYAIPHRDCGSFSAGGLTAAAYRDYVIKLARGLGQTQAFIIVEPDALTLTACLSTPELQERLELLRFAIAELKKNPNAKVYLDAGHSAWLSAADAASRLLAAGVAGADGFALNVANYQTDDELLRYGRDLRSRTGGKTFVIDSSRNGRGPVSSNEFCNPPGRALGHPPRSPTDLDGLDAYLWVKHPGESDGSCNGGPAAGAWWREMALELARNASPTGL